MTAPDFEAFVREQLPRLVRYAVMLTGERELAQDLVQDVMVKAHRNWSRVSAAQHPDRYATAMVTNAYLSWRRRWAVRHVFATGHLPEVAVDASDGADHADLWHRLAALPQRQRAAVVLRYYEGMPDPEIADVLGCSPTTVRVHIHRALKTLRLELTDSTASLPTT